MKRVDRGFARKAGNIVLKRNPDLFISHNSANKIVARQVAKDLSKLGIDSFLDEWELEGGDSLHRCLAVALDQSKFVGVLMSPLFTRSEWCLDELSQALAREKATKEKVIIPILIESATAPPFLADRLYVDMRPSSYYPGLALLSRLIHKLSGAKVTAAIACKAPDNISEVAALIKSCGWDNTSCFEGSDIDEFVDAMREHRIPFTKNRDGTISVEMDHVYKHRRVLEHFEVAKIFIELDPPDWNWLQSARLDDSFFERASFSQLLHAARAIGHTHRELANELEVSPVIISRWESGTSSPVSAVESALKKKLAKLVIPHANSSRKK